MELSLIGWLACAASLTGATLAGSSQQKLVYWGWMLFFVGNLCWVIYGVSTAALPIIAYNTIRAFLSLRGAHNNSKHKKHDDRD